MSRYVSGIRTSFNISMFSDGHVEELLFNNLQIQLMPLFSVNMKMCMQLEDSQQVQFNQGVT